MQFLEWLNKVVESFFYTIFMEFFPLTLTILFVVGAVCIIGMARSNKW